MDDETDLRGGSIKDKTAFGCGFMWALCIHIVSKRDSLAGVLNGEIDVFCGIDPSCISEKPLLVEGSCILWSQLSPGRRDHGNPWIVFRSVCGVQWKSVFGSSDLSAFVLRRSFYRITLSIRDLLVSGTSSGLENEASGQDPSRRKRDYRSGISGYGKLPDG